MSQAIEKLASRTVRGRKTAKAKIGQPVKPLEGNAILARSPASVEPERRHEWIAQAAYFLAERRSFEPGFELQDWYAAEQEIDGLIARGEFPG